MPGQKSIRLAKKGGDSPFLDAGFRRFSQQSLCLRVSLRKRGKENWQGFSRPFLASAPAFLPGQRRDGYGRPTNLEMIQK